MPVICNPVELTGKNSIQNIIAIIPARQHSTRLPGKLLLPVAGKPLILHTLERAKAAINVSRVIVATDSEEIWNTVVANGDEAVMTSPGHQSGSDRIAEAAAGFHEDSIIVNVQGDEPLIDPETIEKAVSAIIEDNNADITTICEPIREIRDLMSPDVVKVVTGREGYALYFSRSPIPFLREEAKQFGSLEAALIHHPNLLHKFRKHMGLYVYRKAALDRFTKCAQTPLEKSEMLEQLRALENGMKIKVVEVSTSSIGVDTRDDYDRVKAILKSQI